MNTRAIASEYRLSQWAQVMQSRAESGLSVRAYCAKAGIRKNSYYYWQRKLREVSCEGLARLANGSTGLETATMFTEVLYEAQVSTPQTKGNKEDNLSIEFPGVQVSVGSEYPVEKLAYLIKAVVQSC